MAQSRRRVSYIIPPPTEPVPRLQLPPYGVSRLGATGPLLQPSEGTTLPFLVEEPHKPSKYPRHRLGVSSLALDFSTHLTGRNVPEGILYSGGRDGLIMSWDLHIPMKKRIPRTDNDIPRSQWEMITGWGDVMDEDEEEERGISDGDVLGEVTGTAAKKQKSVNGLPYEQQWETDLESFQPGQPSSARQCAYMQTDWINDIVLCNYNQTVVSASSDGTVKAWNPHSQQDPSIIGTHNDYVRCLTYCREQNWVASGSFDRTIKLWDLSRPANAEALVSLNPADASAPKSSVYALATDPFGHAIASGTPERVVRLWDPRSGKRTGKLVGHTDNIRAILISEDSRYLLTGSADASIKLWSLANQRCLHTFTHHTDSVWSLFSSHPSLEIFYSGDRTGLVCRVDVEDCADVSEGECILLCHDTHESSPAEGINKIVAMDDNLVWTAAGSSSINRWKVPLRRAARANPMVMDLETDRQLMTDSPRTSASLNRNQSGGSSTSFHSDNLSYHEKGDKDTLFGVPFESLVRLTSPNDTFYSSRGRDPEVATLYSAASVMSVPRTNVRSPTQSNFTHQRQHHTPHSHTSPIRSPKTDETVLEMPTARLQYEEREIAADAQPLNHEPESVIPGDSGLVRSIILNDRVHALTVDTSGEVAVWDIVRCICKGKYTKEDVASASMRGSTQGSDGGMIDRERSPREALESVRERIEGEAFVLSWATADTKGGLLTIHLNEKCFDAEVYADEVGFAHDRYVTDESKLNIGKWVLRNLFLAFIREEQKVRRRRDRSNSHDSSKTRENTSHEGRRRPSRPSSLVISSHKMLPAVAPAVVSSARSSPLLTPMIPLHMKDGLPAIPQSPNDATPMPRARSGTLDSATTPAPPSSKDLDYFSVPRRPSIQNPPTPDEFSGWSGPGKSPETPMTPSGLMGRIVKNFKGKKSATDTPSTPAAGQVSTILEASSGPENSENQSETEKTPLQALLSGPLSPPPSSEAPLHNLPNHITLLISEEVSLGYRAVYRGTVNSTGHDFFSLEEAMPMWLIEYLLTNKTTAMPPLVKISFILLPYPSKDPDREQLPELLNITQSKLTASRWLRVRKLVNHVQDKLDKIANNANNPEASSKANSPRVSIDSQYSPRTPRPRAEDLYEILCNDVLLPLDMTLAAVRQYVWRQSSELTMYYRAKTPSHPTTISS
ncbi:WD40 repeat-like protein [Dendrothele bispora CBS 962.96]|uniref:WD40 repeat-like protein n=1 Tax=Dendrothele bispora (strain CBS 962.96) TaxID=1314807 RepID=A0A4S8KVS6_DENBC|nr:WD40 repeat-like protein [Dendrothele bispora CBS 962.96]